MDNLAVKTQEQLITDMLANISDDYEKSIGFLTRDLTFTNAIELAKLYQAIVSIANLRLVKDLTGDDLTARVYDNKGLVRKLSTRAKVALNITGTGTVSKGDVFSTATDLQFASLEEKNIVGTGTILAECLQGGIIGMVGANSIIAMPVTIQGIVGVSNPAPSYDGFEEEADENLVERYYEVLKSAITSGNMAHYEFWAKSVAGVGKAKVLPLWNGQNTVKTIIINVDMQPASLDLIKQVQEYIDPMGINNVTWGTGAGEAPIGAYCTVTTAIAKSIDITVDVDLASGYDVAEIQTAIKQEVAAYLKTIAFSDTIKYVSHAKIGSLILQVPGVMDYRNLSINGSPTANVDILDEEVAIVGNVVVS